MARLAIILAFALIVSPLLRAEMVGSELFGVGNCVAGKPAFMTMSVLAAGLNLARPEAGEGGCGPMDAVFADGFEPCGVDGCGPPAGCSGTNVSCGCTTCIDCTALPNVGSTSCSGEQCAINTCAFGYANCDADTSNGCEVQNSGHSNAAPGQHLGNYPGDTRLGSFCSVAEAVLQQTLVGSRGRHFEMRAEEESDCIADIALSFELDVPPGVDYNLVATGACQCEWWNGNSWVAGCQAERGSGLPESLLVWCEDDFNGDDSFDAFIEVRHISGASCETWTLDAYSRDLWLTEPMTPQ